MEEALKKEEFRKLLVDYAKELRDPDNRKVSLYLYCKLEYCKKTIHQKYEEEITQLERERGQDVKFLSSKVA